MNKAAKKLQIAEIIGTWVAAIAVVFGGLFGAFQYLEHKAAKRIDRSMSFVERYQSNNFLVSARLKISDSMNQHIPNINELLTDPELTADEVASIYSNEVVKIVESDQLTAELEQIFTFYEQIILCRDMELCDGAVTTQFFDVDAKAYIRTFYPYICNIRDEWNNPKQYERLVNFYVGNSAELCIT